MFAGIFTAASAQTAETGARPSVVMGDVTAMSAGKIALQTKDGTVDVALTEKTEFKRVTPENPNLRSAVAAALSDIGVGDKLVVSGVLAADKKSLPARTVFLMTKSDIAQKQAKESDQWRTRGVAGKVVSVNPQNNQITIEVRGLANTTSVVLTPKESAKFRRYAPNSVKYSEAKTSSVGEIKAGDMLRALGDKSADGAAFAAEEVLTGAFQTVAGTVKTINAAKGEVVISDFQTKKDITISVGAASTLKNFPKKWRREWRRCKRCRRRAAECDRRDKDKTDRTERDRPSPIMPAANKDKAADREAAECAAARRAALTICSNVFRISRSPI
jgi:hypothetical protein